MGDGGKAAVEGWREGRREGQTEGRTGRRKNGGRNQKKEGQTEEGTDRTEGRKGRQQDRKGQTDRRIYREKEESTDGMKGQKEGGGQREGREGSRTQIGEGRERTERCLIFSHSYDTYSRRSRAVHCSLPSAHNENMSAGRLGKPGWPHQFETI